MKLSWKEILVIFVLAVLATGLSWFVAKVQYAPFCGPGYFAWCAVQVIEVGGWPFPYLLPKDVLSPTTVVVSLPLDILIYVTLFCSVWIVLRKLLQARSD